MNKKVVIADVEFKNPIIAASGTFGFGREYDQFYDISLLGGISTKGLTLLPREGNDSPRVCETSMGMLNSVGLQNPGVEAFIRNDLPFLKSKDIVVIANVAGNVEADYMAITERLSSEAVDMIELNISCPNVKEGGMAFGIRPSSVERITRAVRDKCKKPLIVKLSPNVESIADNARAAEAGGADAISLINTLTGLAIDYKKRTPILKNIYGGLSGPCIKPIALRMVHLCYKAVKVPIIGLGGIASAVDIVEFMIAGARAIQIGTANFFNPNIGKELTIELTELMKSCNINDVNEIVGTLKY